MKLNILPALMIFVSVLGCIQSKPTTLSNTPQQLIDTSKAIKVSGQWVIPNNLIDQDTAWVTGDTLKFITCNDFVYNPFGKTTTRSDLRNTLLKKFTISDKVVESRFGSFKLNMLNYKSSKLAFFLDDDDTLTHSNIAKGEIYDSEAELLNGIKVGMTDESFYKKFFKFFPDELRVKYKVVALNACVDDITHIYSFEYGKLKSIKFTNQYVFNVEF
ncbi:hypothetical protein [Mucilaginibacter pedocola]|uniref:Lipoprotein n=1 Tax=Mucilaginibacter pedocola TaxID=1792845 RepID=A0A1S9PHX1_9SPHI|nr:hypothetical protein [Mucilaginibacter pedocola]OOQ60564.1 hypothetical protein BC343_25070 [Mucilaginibacter pedocola]